jgi:small conductance mechanosensitive channel
MEQLDNPLLVDLINRASGLISIIVILIAAWLALRLVNLARNNIHKRLEREYTLTDDRGRLSRLNTLLVVGMHSARVVIIVLALFSLLSKLGVDIAPLLASVGAVGLALSLGAQTLIKDYIFGLILLVENQYGVGERVSIGGQTGVVERITMRGTWLRGDDGQLSSIPHGDVRTVTNFSRDWGLVHLEFGVRQGVSQEDAQRTADEAIQKAVRQRLLADDLIMTPSYAWWDSPQEHCSKLSISARSTVDARLQVEDALRQDVTEAFKTRGMLAE